MGELAPIIMSGLAALFRKSSDHEPKISKNERLSSGTFLKKVRKGW
jgi:hypothetical protein